MSRSGKRSALLVAVLLLLASLVACTPSSVMEPESPDPPVQPAPQEPNQPPVDVDLEPDDPDDYHRVAVYSPVSIPWLTVSPLEITEQVRNQGRYQDRLTFIKGLRDDDVQAAINDNLSELYVHLKERDLPPMRGIRLLVRAEAKPVANSIQAQTYFSYNNVLSVVVTNFREYRISGNSHYMHMAETRNFDLTTGREITLRHVLTDDVDYLKVISDAVSDQLLRSSITDEHVDGPYEAGLGFSAVSPFRGIREDQVFYLTPAGIALVLDYRTPEFDTGFWHRSLQVPFSQLDGHVALTKRFEHPVGDLYISQEPPVYEFVHPAAGGVPRERFSREEYVDNVLVLASLTSYAKGIPDAVANFIQQQYEAHTSAEARLKAMADSYWLLTHRVTSTRTGPFTTVSVVQRQFKSNKPFDINEAEWLDLMGYMGDQNVTMTSRSYTFDANGKSISLSSLFVRGFDYQLAIKAAYDKQVAHYHWIKPPQFSEVCDDMQFVLGVSDVSFRTHSVSWGDHMSPIHFSLSFKDIGCDNMSIFPSP